jgi:hypothetical protein
MNTWNSLLISLGHIAKRSASATAVLEHQGDAIGPGQSSPADVNRQRTRGSKNVSDHQTHRIPWLSFR